MNIIDPFVLPRLPLAWKHGLPAISAVYFAISKKQILYVGSTKNLKSRWLRHHRIEEIKAFNNIKIAWLEVPNISDLAKLEGQAVSALKPLLNAKQRVKGEGTGRIQWRTITKNGKEYKQPWYDWQIYQKEKILSKSAYISKRLLKQIEQLESDKAPVVEILKLLGKTL